MIRLMLAVLLCGVLAAGCNPTPAAPKAENTKAKAAASVGAAGAIIKFPATSPVSMLLSTAVVTNINLANPAVAKAEQPATPKTVSQARSPSACQNGSCNINGQCTPGGCAAGACANGSCGAGGCGVATYNQQGYSYGYSYGSRRFGGRFFGGGGRFFGNGGCRFGRCR